MDLDTRFKALYPEIKVIVMRRRASWTLSIMAWEDVESILITRIYRQLHLYDPAKPFENWANRLISNQISNILRNNLYKHARPCVAANPAGGDCACNLGGDRCSFTPSGKQCEECPLFARWRRKKESALNISMSLPLDTHIQEVQNAQSDFLDIEGIKPQIDTYVMRHLNKHDAKVYRLLYIDNKSVEEVAKRMKYKTPKSGRTSQVIRKLVARFKDLARDAIETLDL